jgi:hypothetical protein
MFKPISSFCLCLLLFLVTACSSQPVTDRKAKKKLTQQKIFFASYDNVWRAAQLALKYPIAMNNMDNGILETELIKADDGFQAPLEDKIPSSGLKYKISMLLVKGKVDGRDSVRVTIKKTMEKRRDFFADPEAIESDGLEEMVIFYRIDRELIIDEALRKAAKAAAN